LCIEMDNRYDLLKEANARNIKEYNEKFIKRRLNPQKGHQYLPFIVLVVDEFADLIMTAGKEVEMPSGYDEMTPRSYANYNGGTTEERARRAVLRAAMEKQGFAVNPEEWWHFDYKDWKLYPIINVKFEDLGQ